MELSDKINEIRSDEVQEILTSIPKWPIRYGITIIFILIFISTCIISNIPYPEHIQGIAFLNSDNHISTVYSLESGYIELYKHNEMEVDEGDDIAYIENTILKQDLDALSKVIYNIQNSNSTTTVVELRRFIYIDEFEKEILELIRVVEDNDDWDKYQRRRDSQNSPNKHSKELPKDVKLALSDLQNEVVKWKNKFLIKAPKSGTLIYLTNLHEKSYVKASQAIFEVVPKQSYEEGYLIIANSETWKIKENQLIEIHLSDYPSDEYGMLEGRVKRMPSYAFREGMSKVIFTLENNLTTTENKTIAPKPRLKGVGQILIKEQTLFEKFIDI